MHGHAAHDDARYMPAGCARSLRSATTRSERLAARLALDGFTPEIQGCATLPSPRSTPASPRPSRHRLRIRRRSRTASTRPHRFADHPMSSNHSVGSRPRRTRSISAARDRPRPSRAPGEDDGTSVDRVDDNRCRLLHLDRPDRPVDDPIRQQPLDRVDVSLARAHLVGGLMEEPPVRLLVECSEEGEVILGHLADGDEHRLEPLRPGAPARHGRPERSLERVLVVAGEQREDLVAPEATPVEGHPRDARLLRDAGQRGGLPPARRDRAAGTFDHALLGALDLCHRVGTIALRERYDNVTLSKHPPASTPPRGRPSPRRPSPCR